MSSEAQSPPLVSVGVGEAQRKKYNNNSAKAFEVLDDQSVCLSLILNPFLKCIKCFESEVPSWQHLWISVETSAPQFPRRCLCSHEKGLIQSPSRSETMWSWTRQTVLSGSCGVWVAKTLWSWSTCTVARILGFYSDLEPHCSPPRPNCYKDKICCGR